MNKQKCVPAVLAIILIASALAQATTVEHLSLDDMTKKARSIVVGKVIGARMYWSGNLILTTYTMDVQETIKGQASRTVQVTAVGGTVGDTTLHVAGMPSFQKGEDAVVFVEQSGAFSTVVGLAQGKFTIEQGEVANTSAGLSFPDGRSGQAVRLPLATFKKQLRTILDRR